MGILLPAPFTAPTARFDHPDTLDTIFCRSNQPPHAPHPFPPRSPPLSIPPPDTHPFSTRPPSCTSSKAVVVVVHRGGYVFRHHVYIPLNAESKIHSNVSLKGIA